MFLFGKQPEVKKLDTRSECPSWLSNQTVKMLRDENLRYPPYRKGLPTVLPEVMIADQSELMLEIEMILPIKPAEFAKYIRPIIVNFASYVQLLPASETHHHRGAGGLFRHSLEVALFAAKAARAVNFTSNMSPNEKRVKQPRFIVASFLAGLLHDIGKPFSDVFVSNENSEQWNPTRKSLFTWAVEHKSKNIFITWKTSRNGAHNHHSLITIGVDRVLTDETQDYLGDEIYTQLFNAVTGLDLSLHIARIMLKADSLSTSRDLKAQNLREDPFNYALPVERYVIDSLRRIALTESVNVPGARLWFSTAGVFINWNLLFPDLRKLIDEDGRKGIPRTGDELASILIDRGFALEYQPDTQTTSIYWTIYPTVLNGQMIKCIRLSSPDIIFPESKPPITSIAFTKPTTQDANSPYTVEDEIDRVFDALGTKLVAESPAACQPIVTEPVTSDENHYFIETNHDSAETMMEYFSAPSDQSTSQYSDHPTANSNTSLPELVPEKSIAIKPNRPRSSTEAISVPKRAVSGSISFIPKPVTKSREEITTPKKVQLTSMLSNSRKIHKKAQTFENLSQSIQPQNSSSASSTSHERLTDDALVEQVSRGWEAVDRLVDAHNSGIDLILTNDKMLLIHIPNAFDLVSLPVDPTVKSLLDESMVSGEISLSNQRFLKLSTQLQEHLAAQIKRDVDVDNYLNTIDANHSIDDAYQFLSTLARQKLSSKIEKVSGMDAVVLTKSLAIPFNNRYGAQATFLIDSLASSGKIHLGKLNKYLILDQQL